MEDYEYSESSSEGEYNKFDLSKYTEIRHKIECDKYNYGLYKELIDEVYKHDDLDIIRSAHELFASMFPLAPSIWLKWIRLEIMLINLEDEIQVDSIMKMFDRAFTDYYSAEVAVEYAKFLNEIQIEDSDKIWDRLMDTYGSSWQYGSQIFDLCRSYYLKSKFIPVTTIPTKIVNIFNKQLKMPLEDIDKTFEELKQYYKKNEKKAPSINWGDINTNYETAKNNLNLILPFEKQLESNTDFSSYAKYLNEVENKIPEDWYQCIYERAITDLCLNADIWIQYVNYVWNRDKSKSPYMQNLQVCKINSKNALDVINQALRNCPWVPQLYVLQMNIAEQNILKYPTGRIKSVLENAFETLISDKSSLSYLWLEYLSYLKRNTIFDNPDEFNIFRQECQEAVAMCYPDDRTILDPLCEIYRFWGINEYKFGNLEQARNLWDKASNKIKSSNQTGIWIQYAELEIENGSIEEARNVFKKGAEAIVSQPVYIQDSFASQFETFYSNRQSMTEAEEIVHGSKDDARSIFYKSAEIIAFEQIYIHNSFWMQFERTYGNCESIRAAEQFIGELMESSNRFCTQPIETGIKEVTLHETRKRKMQRKTSDSQISKRRKFEVEPRKINKTKKIVPQHQHTEVDTTKDSVTIFLSNLHFGVTEEEVLSAFPELTIESINLIKTSNGKGRGFGYLQLNSGDAVKQALTFDQRPIKGRPVFISNIIRDKNKRGVFRYSENREEKKIFIKGVPPLDRDIAEEELKSLFSKYGKIKDIRLVHHKTGVSKGIAYIEYFDEESASNAVNDTDKKTIRDVEIFVAISAPPPREATNPNDRTREMPGTSQMPVRPPTGRPKPRMNLIPVSVTRAMQTKVAPKTPKSLQKISKTNEDFQEMFAKKN